MKRKQTRISSSMDMVYAILIFIAIFAFSALVEDFRYGDWTCMFKTCVLAKDVKNVDVK